MSRRRRALVLVALSIVGCAHGTAPRPAPAPADPASADAIVGERAKRALELYVQGPRHHVEAARIVAQIAAEMAHAHPGEAPLRRGASTGYPSPSPEGRLVLQQRGNGYIRETFIHESGGRLIAVRTDFRPVRWVGPGLLLVQLESVREDGPRLAGLRVWEPSSGAVRELSVLPEQLQAAGGRIVVLHGADPTRSIDVLDMATMAPNTRIAVPPFRGPSCKDCRGVMGLSENGAVVSWFDGAKTHLWSTQSGAALLPGEDIDRVAFLRGSAAAALWRDDHLDKVELSSGRVIARLRRRTSRCTSTTPEWDSNRFTVSDSGSDVLDFDEALTVVDSTSWTMRAAIPACSRVDAERGTATPETARECVYPVHGKTTPSNPGYVAMWWKGGQTTVTDMNHVTELSCMQAKALTASQLSETRANDPGSPRYLHTWSNLADAVVIDLKTLSELDGAHAKALEQDMWRRKNEIDQDFGRLVCSAGELVFPLEICPLTGG